MVDITNINISHGHVYLTFMIQKEDEYLEITTCPILYNRESLKDLYYFLDLFIDEQNISIIDDENKEILDAIYNKLIIMAKMTLVKMLPTMYFDNTFIISETSVRLHDKIENLDDLIEWSTIK